jgi:hypothetical protein
MERRLVLMTFAIAVVAAMLGGGAVVWANHQFSDVPNAGFHGDIEEIVEAGCASGFSDGTFRPNANATRGQFAYWMSNCGGRAEARTGATDFLPDSPDLFTGLGAVSIDSPAAGGMGQALVIAAATVDASADGDVIWRLRENRGSGPQLLDEKNDTIYAPSTGTINPASTVTLMGMVPIEAGESVQFTVDIERADGIPLANVRVDTVAMYFPFAGIS